MRVKNEVDWIIPSILSIKDIADEIVIVDNGSTDGTYEIVEKMASEEKNLIRLWQRPDLDHCSLSNFALDQARYRWIFRWDGDMVALRAARRQHVVGERKSRLSRLAREFEAHRGLGGAEPAVDEHRVAGALDLEELPDDPSFHGARPALGFDRLDSFFEGQRLVISLGLEAVEVATQSEVAAVEQVGVDELPDLIQIPPGDDETVAFEVGSRLQVRLYVKVGIGIVSKKFSVLVPFLEFEFAKKTFPLLEGRLIRI